jgi:tryptophan halogenase
MTAVKRVVVVGRDAAFWLSLLALHRALTPAGIHVSGIQLPSQLEAPDAYAALPTLTGLHDQLGLDRHDVLRAAAGLPVQGQRFSGWGPYPFVHGYDGPRAAIDHIDILHFWIAGRAQGLGMPYEELSVASVAARQGRIGPDGRDPATFGTCHRGYHLDARAYVEALANLAGRQGIQVIEGTDLSIERSGNRVTSISFEGRRVEADLYVDASGCDSLLASAAFESWSSWFPADRLLSASLPKLNPLPAFSELRAFADGWAGLFPLRHRTAVQGAFKSRRGQDDEILSTLPQILGATPRDLVVRPFNPGVRVPWSGNVVAIGDSFATLEPLDAVQLHFIHAGLSNLLAWFPTDNSSPPEATSYNAVMARYAANIRDFMVVHYHLNDRTGELLWDKARAAPIPPTLAAKMSPFGARGLNSLNDDETFDEGSWIASLIGHGLIPRSYDPRVDLIPFDDKVGKMQRLLSRIADEVGAMPTIEGYLAP